MEYGKLIEKKVVEVEGRRFTISQIPAYYAHGFYEDFLASMSRFATIGYLTLPGDTIADILSFAAYTEDEGATWKPMDADALKSAKFADNKGKKTVATLLKEMMEYNFGFFFDGSLLDLAIGRTPAEETEAEQES